VAECRKLLIFKILWVNLFYECLKKARANVFVELARLLEELA